jgi:hypothetical protein
MSRMPIENPVFMLIGESHAGPEQDFDLKVEDLRTIGEKGARVTLRLPTRVYGYIAGLAQSNRRSFAAEVQAALEAHEALSRLSALMDQDLQQARRAASGGVHGVVGETAERMSETIRRDLSNIWASSFGVAGASAAFGAALASNVGEETPDGES